MLGGGGGGGVPHKPTIQIFTKKLDVHMNS